MKSAVSKWGASSSSTATLSGGNWTCSITNLPKGATTVTLEATDNVNKVGSNSLSITVSIPIPQIVLNSKYQHFPTNQSSIKVSYTVDGAGKDTTFSLNAGANTFTIWGPANALGEKDSEAGTIYYLSTVLFVVDGGSGNGSSWDSPYGEISSAITAAGSKSGAIQIWVSEGNYQNFELVRGNTSILGGFKHTDYPFASTSKDPVNNISSLIPTTSGLFAKIMGENGLISNVVFDGFHVANQNGTAFSIREVSNATIRNLWIENSSQDGEYGMITIYHSTANLESVFIRNNTYAWNSPIFIYGGSIVTITKSDISNNAANGRSGAAGIYSEESDVTVRYSHFNNNGKLGETTYNGAAGGPFLDIDYCNVLYGRSSFYPDIDSDPSGSVIIWGTNNCDYGQRLCMDRF